MELNNIQQKIIFYKEKIALCQNIKAQIPSDDPYRDYKIQNMNYRISLYKEELKNLKADKLTNWNV